MGPVAFQVVAVDLVHLLQVLPERREVLERALGCAAFPLANKALLLGEVGEGGVIGEIHRGAERDRRQVQGARGRRVRVRAEHAAMSACGGWGWGYQGCINPHRDPISGLPAPIVILSDLRPSLLRLYKRCNYPYWGPTRWVHIPTRTIPAAHPSRKGSYQRCIHSYTAHTRG